MTEPVTPNRSLIAPNTGDLPGAWGTSALNPNWQTLDAMFGGTTTISLAGATTILLTVPATTGVWPGSLSQSVNSIIYFTGAQTGNAVIQFTLPGFYIVHNQCTGTSYVQLAPSAGLGNKIGAPPGKKCHVFFDGTNMDYVNMPDPGTAYDLHTNTTSLPPWMLACTVAPYLIKDGTVYTSSVYPALAQLLGSTFGGNGITTFGVPDERNRFRLPVASGTDPSRVTQAISGVNGTTFGATGGDQRLQSHTHTATDGGHTHGGGTSGLNFNGNASGYPSVGADIVHGTSGTTAIGTASITNSATGSGSSQNMPPTIVSFLPLVKT